MSAVEPEVKPMTQTSPKLSTQIHSQARGSLSNESQEAQQSKGMRVVVLSEGERETQNVQMKGEEVKQEPTSRSEAKLITSDPQPLQPFKPDGANKVPDRSAINASVVQGIPSSHGRDEKTVIQQHTSETTFSPPSQKPGTSHISEKIATHASIDEPTIQHIPTEKPSVVHIRTEKPGAPHTAAEESGSPHTPTKKLGTPHTQTEKPDALHTPTEKPTAAPSPTKKPTAAHVPTTKPSVPQISTEKPAVPYIPTEKPSVPHISTEKPTVPYIPTEKSSAPHISTEKASALHVPTEKPIFAHTATEKPTVSYSTTKKPSCSSSRVPPATVTHLKTASHAVHVHGLSRDKLELSIAEKVTEVHSYSEHFRSAGMKVAEVKPVLSQESRKVPEDGIKQDICITHQQNDVEDFQKAQKADSATQSAGNVPKETVLLDKSASRILESGKNASRTYASKREKVTYCLPFIHCFVTNVTD
jgi:hypothetical protein